ncbi:MAG TPA: hypothetical protein VFF11_10125 [Candidatus Binatia bacterium]|nr:hypothetical protein [Candidatus Binatia bacterium]
MFIGGGGALWAETNFGPGALGNERSGRPVHRKIELVEFPAMNMSADRARLESGKKLLSLSLDNPAKNGGGGRNRPDFPAVAVQICLILLGIQAIPALSGHIFFNRFGVRFGVRLINTALLWNGCDSAMANISVR